MEQNDIDKITEVAEEQFKKIQRTGIMIGAQTFATVILEKIIDAKKKPGRFTLNDYRRLVDEIERFCKVGVSRKINDETIQNEQGGTNEVCS